MKKLPLIFLFYPIIAFTQINSVEKQLHFYNEKCKSFWETSLDSSIYYGNKAISIENLSKNREEASKSYLYLAVALYYQSQFDASISHLEKGLEIAQKGESLWGEAFAYNMLCVLYRNKADYKKAVAYGLKNIEIRETLKDTLNLAGGYQNLSNIYSLTGDPQTAIDYLSKSVELHIAMKDTLEMAQIQGTIANLYLDLGETENAEKLLLKSMKFTEKNTLDYADFSLNLGTVYQNKKDFITSEKLYKEALKIYESIGLENGIGVAYENLGELYIDTKNFQKAIEYLKLAENNYEKTQDSTQIAHINLSIGKYYLNISKTDSANIYLQRAIELGRLRKHSKVVSGGLYSLYELNKKLGNSDRSLSYFEEYTFYKDSLQKQLIDNRFSYWNSQMKGLEKEREIENLKHDKEKLKWQASRYYFVILILFILIFSGSLILYLKRKKDRQLAEKKRLVVEQEKQLIKAELETKNLKEKELEQELEFKSKQLSTHALHMMQKNKMLQEVKNQMEDLIQNTKNENKPDLRKINRLLDRNIKTDKEWKLFKLYFEELNSNFFNDLKKLNAKLTQNELKICALTKLGFNLKETASLLNVSINTVKNARYRLKLKIGIEREDSLKEFIDNLGNF